MKLTIWNRIKICVEVLTIRSGHSHTAQEKQLSVFQHGYLAGLGDGKLECRETVANIKLRCSEIAEQCACSLFGTRLRENIKRAVFHE